MRFRDSDVRPNTVTPLASVRVGATRDARWHGLTGDSYVSVRVHEFNRRMARLRALARVGRIA